MGEYEPITKGLRWRLEVAALGLPKHRADELLAECDNIDAIQRSLEKENERLRNASERGDDWIKLPLDADRVPTLEGDELWSDNGVWVKVKRLEHKNGKWAVFVENKMGISFYAIVEDMHHYRPDTWESIIADAIGCEPHEVAEDDDLMAFVARCKALCERTRKVE